MFNTLKNFLFGAPTLELTTEATVTTVPQNKTPSATIMKNDEGRFEVVTARGTVATYSRKLDAIRGATRRGYKVV